MGLFNKNAIIKKLINENVAKDMKIKRLENLCEQKDKYFKELMSDALRHGSTIAAQHMADRKKYLNKK